jgi:hypothetical protein
VLRQSALMPQMDQKLLDQRLQHSTGE